MGRKKIPKGRGEEKIEKRELNEIFQLEMGFIGVLLIIGFFSIMYSILDLPFGQKLIGVDNTVGQASKVCIDSDKGIIPLKRGETTGIFNDIYITKIDECSGNTLKEYYCDILECASCAYVKDINCPNDCIGGACI